MTICAIVAANEQVCADAQSALAIVGISAAWISCIAELPKFLIKTPVSGILLELPTMMRASASEKQILQELPSAFPLAKFRMAGAELITAGIPLERFAATCAKFNRRVMRAKARTAQNLCVWLSAQPGFDVAEKTMTLNCSAGGCQVYSVRDWTVGDMVWLRYWETGAVVCGTVRFATPWGCDARMPGIGIEFAAVDEDSKLVR